MLDPVAARVRLDPHVGELAVGERHQRAVGGADARRSQADGLDGAGEAVHRHVVADAEGLVHADGEGSEEVLHRLLRREGEGDAADAEAGEEAADGDAERREPGEQGADQERDLEHLGAERHQRLRRRVGLGGRLLEDAARADVDAAGGEPHEADEEARAREGLDEVLGGRDEGEARQRERDGGDGPDHRERRGEAGEDRVVPGARGAREEARDDLARDEAEDGAGPERHQEEDGQRDPLPVEQVLRPRAEQGLGEVVLDPVAVEPAEPGVDVLHGRAREDPARAVGEVVPDEAHWLGAAQAGDVADQVDAGGEVVGQVAERLRRESVDLAPEVLVENGLEALASCGPSGFCASERSR